MISLKAIRLIRGISSGDVCPCNKVRETRIWKKNRRKTLFKTPVHIYTEDVYDVNTPFSFEMTPHESNYIITHLGTHMMSKECIVARVLPLRNGCICICVIQLQMVVITSILPF